MMREVQPIVLTSQETGELKSAGFDDEWLAKIEPELAQNTRMVLAKHLTEKASVQTEHTKLQDEHKNLKRSHDELDTDSKWTVNNAKALLANNLSKERLDSIKSTKDALTAAQEVLVIQMGINEKLRAGASATQIFSTMFAPASPQAAAPAATGQKAQVAFNSAGGSQVDIPVAKKQAISNSVSFVSMHGDGKPGRY
jgi:hypothetical protein